MMEQLLSDLREEGFVILRNAISITDIERINSKVDYYYSLMPNSVQYIDPLMHKTLYRFELTDIPAVCSEAVESILKSCIPELAEKYFGEEPRVGVFVMRKCLMPSFQ